MAFTNFDTKEINCKIVYFGPRESGKTTNLQAIYNSTSAEIKSGLLSLDDEKSATKYFDFLPMSIGYVRDFHVKLHLFTVPVSSLYETVTSVILKGLDGVIFVADSKIESMAANIEHLENMKKLLSHEGYQPSTVPMVFQYNKRDLHDIVPLNVLRQELNTARAIDHEAVATEGVGTLETLQTMAKIILQKLNK